MSQTQNAAIAVVGIDIGKNSFHIVGHDERGAIVLRQKWSRGQVEARFANMPPCLVGMEACVGAHHLNRKLRALGHDARLMPAKYVRPYSFEEARFVPTTATNSENFELLCRLIEPRVDLFPKQGEVDGLGQQAGRAAFYRLPLGFGIAVGGDHDDGDFGSHRPDFW